MIFWCHFAGCGADLTGPSGTFLSPNYPNAYNRLAECYWTITVAQGSSVILLMVDLDIENHQNCQYDYVEVSYYLLIRARLVFGSSFLVLELGQYSSLLRTTKNY